MYPRPSAIGSFFPSPKPTVLAHLFNPFCHSAFSRCHTLGPTGCGTFKTGSNSNALSLSVSLAKGGSRLLIFSENKHLFTSIFCISFVFVRPFRAGSLPRSVGLQCQSCAPPTGPAGRPVVSLFCFTSVHSVLSHCLPCACLGFALLSGQLPGVEG